MGTTDPLHQGREAYGRQAWGEAYRTLSRADRAAALAPEDLERLATAAYLTGREAEFREVLERAHQAQVVRGEVERAGRCAFWLGMTLLLRGDAGQAGGWLARARRLVERRACAEHGYLLLPEAERHLHAGNAEAAEAEAVRAAEIGERFGDLDLVACGRHVQGRALILKRQVRAGLALLDEAMLAVVGGDLSPIMTGLIYCSVIAACQEVFAGGRAREWTAALSRWCARQPELVAFTSTCLVHRAEILQVQGAWPEAMAEACRAGEGSAAASFYRRGEIQRLRGERAEAEEAYRQAAQLGAEPQPGLALLRLAQGRTVAACAALRRVLGATADPLRRAALLPAAVEVLLAAAAREEAEGACAELEGIASAFDTEVLHAMAWHARGEVALAGGDALAALPPLRRAFERWSEVEAPLEAARARVLAGLACRALGDEEAAVLELQAARAVFERLGAAPELARVDAALEKERAPHRLTPRELEVLRLVAAGKTNRAIAATLGLSERTVDRHVGNILARLDVPSRAAATAYAYEHGLL